MMARLKITVKVQAFGFIQDVNALDLSRYDMVITDFEPVSAWAARMQNKPCIGIGHQYAFQYAIPVAGNNPATSLIMTKPKLPPCPFISRDRV